MIWVKILSHLVELYLLESFDIKSDDEYESCLLGKLTKSPFIGTCERSEGLLGLVHTNLCGPSYPPQGMVIATT